MDNSKTIRNKILVTMFLEDDCKQEDDEVSISWVPINFAIYSDLFPEMIQNSIDSWLNHNKLERNTLYEVIFAHVIEHDMGAVHSEYFDPIFTESQIQ